MRGSQEAADLPPPSFEILVAQLGTPALVQLGQIPNPITGKTEISLPRARFTIELLRILANRTEGKLSQDEERSLRSFLAMLQARYADAARAQGGGSS